MIKKPAKDIWDFAYTSQVIEIPEIFFDEGYAVNREEVKFKRMDEIMDLFR